MDARRTLLCIQEIFCVLLGAFMNFIANLWSGHKPWLTICSDSCCTGRSPFPEMLPPSSNEAVATAARQRSAQVDGKMVRPRPKSAESKEEIRAPPTPPTPAARPSNAIASQAADPVVPEIEEDGIYDNAKLRKGAEDGTAPPELLLRNEVPDVSINPEYSFVTEDAEMEDVYGTMSHYGDAKPGPENAGA